MDLVALEPMLLRDLLEMLSELQLVLQGVHTLVASVKSGLVGLDQPEEFKSAPNESIQDEKSSCMDHVTDLCLPRK